MIEQTTRKMAATNALPIPRWPGILLLLAAIVIGSISTAGAAEWRLDPILRVAGDYDDNPFLSIRTDVEEDASGTIVEGAARIAYSSERTEFFITPRLRSRQYGSNSDLDSDDQFVDMNWTTRTQSTDIRIRGNYSRESARTGERADTDFDVEDPEDIPDDESGRVGIRDRRERIVISPSILYRLSDVSSVTARISYQDVDYAESFAGILTDYTDTRMNLSYGRAFSPRNTAILRATYRTYESAGGASSVDGYGFNLGFDRRITENTRFRALAGIENTELLDGDTEASWVADVSIYRQLETTTLLAQYRRSINSSGAGQLGARDSINLSFRRDLNDTITAGLGARIYSVGAVSGSSQNFNDQNYVQLQSLLTWNLSEVFSIDAEYRYTFLDRESLGESSNSNEITIWFNYRPTPMIRSR